MEFLYDSSENPGLQKGTENYLVRVYALWLLHCPCERGVGVWAVPRRRATVSKKNALM